MVYPTLIPHGRSQDVFFIHPLICKVFPHLPPCLQQLCPYSMQPSQNQEQCRFSLGLVHKSPSPCERETQLRVKPLRATASTTAFDPQLPLPSCIHLFSKEKGKEKLWRSPSCSSAVAGGQSVHPCGQRDGGRQGGVSPEGNQNPQRLAKPHSTHIRTWTNPEGCNSLDIPELLWDGCRAALMGCGSPQTTAPSLPNSKADG